MKKLLILGLLIALCVLIGPAMAGTPSITSNKEDYAPGETVVLTGANWMAGESVNIFVNDNDGQTWSYNTDVNAKQDGTFSISFSLPDWFVAAYRVTATGTASGVATTTFTDAPAPNPSSITPAIGFNTGTVSVTIAGSQFNTGGATVKLTKTGQTDIAATSVVVVSSTQITCNLPITGAVTGTWNVVVTNTADGKSGTLANGFTVISPISPVVGGSAVVDGFYDEWNLATDFFGDMYVAGDSTKPPVGKSYIRYDCNSKTVYVLVLNTTSPILAAGYEAAAWTAINSISNKMYTGNSGNNGVPPDFAWIGLNSGGLYAQGYEASFTLDPGLYTVIVHVDGVNPTTGEPATFGTVGFKTGNDPLYLACPGADNPQIYVEKYVSVDGGTTWFTADSPTGPSVSLGATVKWRYNVTNTGNVALSSVTVTDSKSVTVTCPQTTLTPGETMTCTASGTAVAGQYTNTATATGTPLTGPAVSDVDDANYLGPAPAPSIAIVKKTNGDDANSAPGPSIAVGGAVSWTYDVTNNGNVDLTGVTVADDQGVIVTCPPTTLAPGVTIQCTASGTATAGQYANIGTATGYYGTTPVTATDPSHYFGTTGPVPAPEFPTLALPVAMLIGVIGAMYFVKTREK